MNDGSVNMTLDGIIYGGACLGLYNWHPKAKECLAANATVCVCYAWCTHAIAITPAWARNFLKEVYSKDDCSYLYNDVFDGIMQHKGVKIIGWNYDIVSKKDVRFHFHGYIHQDQTNYYRRRIRLRSRIR